MVEVLLFDLSGMEVSRLASMADPENNKGIGKPVSAMTPRKGELQLRVDGGKLVADYRIKFSATEALETIHPRLKMLGQRTWVSSISPYIESSC